MPDYEIRLFHPDGTLAVVHVAHHETDGDAHAHAQRLKGEHTRYEIYRHAALLKEQKP